ncbi:MAG: hypothetical protein ACYSTJ_04955 [Planctomycetota bacterium]|jgi:hypothetical protein
MPDLTTKQKSYETFRDTVSSADSDLTASTKTWATFISTYHPRSSTNKPAIQLPSQANRITVIFDHKNANTDTATFIIYAYREGGPAEYVCSSTLTAGAQETDDATTRYYADTIGTVTDRWPETLTESDSGGNNGVAKITFDARGYKYLLCLFTAISTNDDVRARYAFH